MSRSISPSRTTIHLPPLPKPECLTANDIASNYGPMTLKRPTRLPRPRYRTCVEKPRGVQDFFNIMWDPHVYRGPAFKTIDQDREERCKSKSIQNNLNSKASARNVPKLPQRKLGGIPWPIEVPETHRHSFATQCERFLIDSIEEIKLLDKTIQTPCYVIPSDECAKKPKEKFSYGIDASTQMEVCDLFDMIELIGSIAETLAEKISEQSILEMMEEEEISALIKFETAMKQRELDDRRNVSQLEERVKLEQFEENEIAQENIKQAEDERTLQGLFEQKYFAKSAMEMVKRRLFISLKKRGYFIDSQLNIERRFIPWLNHMVDCELEHRTIPCAIIDDMLDKSISERVQLILDPRWFTLEGEYSRNSMINSLENEALLLYSADVNGESDYD